MNHKDYDMILNAYFFPWKNSDDSLQRPRPRLQQRKLFFRFSSLIEFWGESEKMKWEKIDAILVMSKMFVLFLPWNTSIINFLFIYFYYFFFILLLPKRQQIANCCCHSNFITLLNMLNITGIRLLSLLEEGVKFIFLDSSQTATPYALDSKNFCAECSC